MKGRKDLALALLGFSILAFAASRIGVHSLLREMSVLRIGLPVIVALSLVRLALQTASWSIALRRDGIHCSVGELMLVRLASQGIGYLTILGPAASEPMKISLLRNHPRSAATATLVDTGVYWFTSGLVGIAGCLAAAIVLVDSRNAATSMLILAAVLVAGLFLIVRPKSPFTALGGVHGVRGPRWLTKAVEIDTAIRKFASEQPSAIRRMFLLDLVCQVLLAAEVVTVFWCLKLPLHAGTLLGLEAATRMIKIAAGWMPARIGADESGAAGAFAAFGLPAASGLVLALARRTRDLLGCLIGLTWLAWRQRSSALTSEARTVSA